MQRIQKPKPSLPERMAARMRDRAASDGACTRDDLLAAGFTADEIDTHADYARCLAGSRYPDLGATS